MLDFFVLAQQCAPYTAPQTMAAIVRTESSFNPYAIGVVGGRLQRQPRALDEAVATATALHQAGWNFSVGLAQVNKHNLPKYKLSYEQAFDPCANLRAGSHILAECYGRAKVKFPGQEQAALNAAFSCYYSGNFTRGFKSDRKGDPSYVQKVIANADIPAKAIPVVPAIAGKKPQRDAAAVPAQPVTAVSSSAPAGAEQPAAVRPPNRDPADNEPFVVDYTQDAAAGAVALPVAAPAALPDDMTRPVRLRAEPSREAAQDASAVQIF